MTISVNRTPSSKSYSWVELGDLVEFRRGLTYKKSDEVESSTTGVLRANNVDLTTGQLNLSEIRWLSDDLDVPRSRKLVADSLLICTASGSRAHLGKMAHITSAQDFAFGGFMGLLLPKPALSARYLWYFSRSNAYRDYLDSLAPGTNINNLRFDDLAGLPLLLPPLDEQKRIVAVLDQAFAALDRARTNAEANRGDTSELSATVMLEMLAGLEASEHALGDICEIYQPRTISTKDLVPDGPYIVFGANGIIGRYDQYNHQDSEVLVTCRGATCGQVNVSEPFSWVTGNAMVVRPRSNAMRKDFLELVLRHAVDWTRVITGAAQPQITRSSLTPVRIPVPALDVQDLAVEKFRILRSHFSQLENAAAGKLADIAALRQSLLQAAFSGELT